MLERFHAYRGTVPLQGSTIIERFGHPLIADPGADLHYGCSFDWLGLLVERLTGQSLQTVQYISTNMNTNLFPSPISPQIFSEVPVIRRCHSDTQARWMRIITRLPFSNQRSIDHAIQTAFGGRKADTLTSKVCSKYRILSDRQTGCCSDLPPSTRYSSRELLPLARLPSMVNSVRTAAAPVFVRGRIPMLNGIGAL